VTLISWWICPPASTGLLGAHRPEAGLEDTLHCRVDFDSPPQSQPAVLAFAERDAFRCDRAKDRGYTWRENAGMRDVLIHAYDRVGPSKRCGITLSEQLPALLEGKNRTCVAL